LERLNTIALGAASLAAEQRTIADPLAELGEVNEDLTEAGTNFDSLPDMFISVLDSYFTRAGAEERNTFETWSLAALAATPEYQTREGLIGTVSGMSSQTIVDELTLLINAMSDAEVSVVLDTLTDPNYFFPLSYVSHWTLLGGF